MAYNLHTYNSAEALNLLCGCGLTFTRVLVNTTATLELLAKTAGQTQRLHGLFVTMDAQDTLVIEDKDSTALTGIMNFPADGPLVIPFNAHPESAVQSASAGQGLQITVAGAGNCRGYAIVSTG